MDVLIRLREADAKLRQLVRHLIASQLEDGRAFVLENPHRSRLWEMPEFRDLRHHPGVCECVVDSGAYGGTTETGEPIIKPFKFWTSIPGASTWLNLRMTPAQKCYTTPVEGAHTTASQVYPAKLVTTLLKMFYDYIRMKEPARFGYYQAFPIFQNPVSDLAAWDPVADTLARSFGTTTTRPFYVPMGDIGKKVSELFWMRLTRIQCVQTPTQRRLPMDIPFTVRGAFVYADNSRAVEIEDLGQVQQPKVKGWRNQLEESVPEPRPGEPEAPITNLPTDVTFPELSSQVPIDVRRAIPWGILQLLSSRAWLATKEILHPSS